MAERLRECAELQDTITAARREALIGSTVEVLVDSPGEGRTYREAPEIDGIVRIPDDAPGGIVRRAGGHRGRRAGPGRRVRRGTTDRRRAAPVPAVSGPVR